MILIRNFYKLRTNMMLELILPLRKLHYAHFRAAGEPPRAVASLGVSPMPLFPRDKEGFGSVTSHAEKVLFFFKESPLFPSLICDFIFLTLYLVK